MTPQRIVTAFLIAAALALTLLWPGDVSWGSDEPRLIAEAWHANHDGELARGGLWGNFGIRYGPLPTWIYQLLLLITHDPVRLIVIRALLCAGATAGGLLWLGRELRLPSWFAAAILAAPYVLQYHRLLWDASFAVPLGTITLAAFASFLRTGSARTLGVTVAGALLVPTIHPQGLPFTLAVLGWLGWRQRLALRAHWKMLATVFLGLSASHAIWFIEAVYGFLHNLSGSVVHGYPHGADRAFCALAPLLGGNLIGSPHILRQIVADPWLVRLAALLYVIFPLAWSGIFTALFRARKMESPRDVVGLVAVAGLVLQALLFGLMRIPAEPQYFFGTFALHAFLIWLAVDEVRVFRAGTVLGGIYGIAAVSLSVGLAIEVRAVGYRPELSWPTLHNQLALAGKLNAFTDTTASTTVPLYQKYPQALRALRLLNPPGPTDKQTASGKLFIAPRGPNRGEVKLDEGAPGDGATLLDITPLPKGWHPDTW